MKENDSLFNQYFTPITSTKTKKQGSGPSAHTFCPWLHYEIDDKSACIYNETRDSSIIKT